MALIGNTRQATNEGISGPVETGLTRLVAMALVHQQQIGFANNQFGHRLWKWCDILSVEYPHAIPDAII